MSKYGKFFTENVTSADDIMVTYSNETYTDEVLRADHWFPVTEPQESSDSPYRVFHYTWVDDDDGGHIEETYTIVAPPEPAKQYSKLKILLAAQDAGIGEAFIGLLHSNAMLKLIWDASNTIEDNELLRSYIPDISTALGKTEQEVMAFLDDYCIAE